MRPLRDIRDLVSDTGGMTIVEFAIILIPLCIVLLGGLDLGYQSYVRSVMQGVLNDVARSGSMEAPELGCNDEPTTADMVECAIKKRVNVIARNATYEIDTENFYQFSGVGRSEKLVTDYNNNGRYDTGDCFEDLNENGEYDTDAGREGVGGADDVVFYDVTVTMPRLLPVANFIGVSPDYHIHATAAIRNQPYARQKVPPTVCK
jgi:hypothetical protein